VEVLAEDIASRGGAPAPELTADAMGLLAAQSWRGNIRELRNVLEQAAMRSDTPRIAAAQVAAVLREAGIREIVAPIVTAPAKQVPVVSGLRPLAEQVAELERQAIAAALAATGGNKLAAARLLGISRAKLYERLGTMPEIQPMSETWTDDTASFPDNPSSASPNPV
jgi:DNA-binding NtrC family response regulator